jgi:hypothetical protein
MMMMMMMMMASGEVHRFASDTSVDFGRKVGGFVAGQQQRLLLTPPAPPSTRRLRSRD